MGWGNQFLTFIAMAYSGLEVIPYKQILNLEIVSYPLQLSHEEAGKILSIEDMKIKVIINY